MIHQSLFMLTDEEDFYCSKALLKEIREGPHDHRRPRSYKSGAITGIVIVGILLTLTGSLALLALLVKKAKAKHGFGNRVIKYQKAPELNTDGEDEAKVVPEDLSPENPDSPHRV